MTDRAPTLAKIETVTHSKQNHDILVQQANDAMRAGNYDLAAAFAQAAAAYAVARAIYLCAPE